MSNKILDKSGTNNQFTDYIPNLDEYVYNIHNQMVTFIQHFTGNNYCVICEKPIKISVEDSNEDLEVHILGSHAEMEIIESYITMLKFMQGETQLT